MSNPFAALLEDDSVPNPTTVYKATSNLSINLENIFGFTLSRSRSTTKNLVYLEEQARAFPGRDLDVEILEHALFERLFISNPSEYVLHQNHEINDANTEQYDSKVITYLFHCYVTNLKSKLEVKDAVQSLIMRNVLTALKQPDLYSDQDLFTQFFDILKEPRPMCDEFFKTTYNEFLNDEDGVEGMRDPYIKLLKVIHVFMAKATITTLNPAVFELIKDFTSHGPLGEIFIDYCTPSKKNVGMEYANTLLGALFAISILPKTHGGSYNFFQNPLDQASNTSTENMLYGNINTVIQHIHIVILNLLKCNASVRSRTLTWMGDCLKANADRGKLWNSQMPDASSFTTVSDGFMLNMCAVLLKLCQPFCQPESLSKILKVDPTYCAVDNNENADKGVHLNLSNETCIVPAEGENSSQRVTSSSFTFVSECFYMGHRAIDLGYKVTVDKLVKLNQEMARIERAYNDALNQSSGRSEIVDAIKERMSTEMSRYLSIKAALSEPNLMEMLFHLSSATCFWFNQVSVNVDFPKNGQGNFSPLSQKDIHFSLIEKIPDILKCIPEFIVENIVSYLVFLRRFNPKLFEMYGYEQLKPILTFILIYMGSPKRMKNPHLRARLAEGLEALLPFHKDEPQGLNTLGGYQREMLFNVHDHRKEIVRSLLEVFVGIEMTGQSVQFEQKFNYRRPMYVVMDYLWELSEHQEYFKVLAEEAEKNMEAVTPPLFLRFINLLMNDAVFLLDEALSNMSKLKEMQTARENGEWDRLSSQERAQNMGYMQHIGMIAKFDNILGRDTIKTLERLTSKITIVFTHTTMVDRVAAMLNYFLLNLVGPNQKNFKVKDQKEYSFEPASTVLDICKIYVNLKNSESFCLAVSQDGRSYSPQLFGLAEDVLIRIGGGSLVGELQEVAAKVSKMAEEYQVNEETIAEAPEHFLDPIMSTLMIDPVILPSSKQTVDRTTIARHLLSDQTDPFNRSPLSMDQVIPNNELAQEIRNWLEEKKRMQTGNSSN